MKLKAMKIEIEIKCNGETLAVEGPFINNETGRLLIHATPVLLFL